MNPNPLHTDEQLVKIESIIRASVEDMLKCALRAQNERFAQWGNNAFYDISPEEKFPEILSGRFVCNLMGWEDEATNDELKKILSKIQEETGVHLEVDDPVFRRLMRIALSVREPENQWLDGHPIKQQGEVLKLAFPKIGLHHDCTRLIWNSIGTRERKILGLIPGGLAPVYSMFRQDIQSAIRENQIVYAVYQGKINLGQWGKKPITSTAFGAVHYNEIDWFFGEPVSFPTLAQFCQGLTEPEGGYRVFSSKADALAYLRSGVTLFHGVISEISPILTIANVGRPLRFSPDQNGLLCTQMPPKTGFVLGIEVFTPCEPIDGSNPYRLSNRVMLKTPFDAVRPKTLGQNLPQALEVVEVVDTSWKKIRNRNEAHQAFMGTFSHRPLTINDFRRWFKEFYCEHYLPKRKNGIEKAKRLQALLAALDEAEALGAEYGTDLSTFLTCKPTGNESILASLLEPRRKTRKETWGWTTVRDTFLKPELVTLTRENRDQFHCDFMKTLKNEVPTLKDFLNWLKEFYCKHYLPSQKQGEKKRRAIEAILVSILLPQNDDPDATPLLISEFLDQNPELKKQIQSKRMGLNKKDCWGWQQIEESFLEPERENNEFRRDLG